MNDRTISEAVAKAKDAAEGDGEWGVTLRSYLDAAGVSDADRIQTVMDKIEEARELLACTSLDGAVGQSETLACALDGLFESARILATGLHETADAGKGI